MHRFFAPPANWTGARVALDEAEGRHAVEVLRFRVGDAAIVFDGQGRVGQIRFLNVGRRLVEGEIAHESVVPRPAFELTLVQAVPKGKLFEWILEKAAELGVCRIVPLLSERTVVQLDGEERRRKREKWERVVVEACKQCGQNWLPQVESPVTVVQFVAGAAPCCAFVGSLHPGAVPFGEALQKPLPRAVSMLVGPEGDFTMEEMGRLCAWGAQPVRFGEIVLRVETAAMYALSVLSHTARRGTVTEMNPSAHGGRPGRLPEPKHLPHIL
jgi:16S rRNA (uracil1498-N3)-methyltransferase